MIKSSNITDYIQFLYQEKYKSEASPEVLQSWGQIPETQIEGYLKELYQHWNLDPDESEHLELEFLKRSSEKTSTSQYHLSNKHVPVQSAEKQKPIQFNGPKKEKAHFSKILVLVLIITLFTIIVFLTYQLLNKAEGENFSVPPVSNEHVVSQDDGELSSSESELPAMSANESSLSKGNAMVIKQLFEAEMSQDLERTLHQFAPYVERYWTVNYPTTEEIRVLYENSWNHAKDIKYENIQIMWVNDSTIDAAATYSYQDLEKGKLFKKNIVNRYIFNEHHQIVQAYSI